MTRDSGHWLGAGAPVEVARLLIAAQRSAPPQDAIDRALGAVRSAVAPAAAAGGLSLLSLRAGQGSGWIKWCAWGSAGPLLVAGAIAARSAKLQQAEAESAQSLARSVPALMGRAESVTEPLVSSREVGAAPSDQRKAAPLSRARPPGGPGASMETRGHAPSGRPHHRERPLSAAVDPVDPAVEARAVAPGPSDVERQIILLARVRRAVDGGQPRRALGLLDDCERSFKRQYFTPEALLLRYRAWRLLGAADEAARVSRRLSRAFPHSAQARQVALLETSRLSTRRGHTPFERP